MPIVSKEIAEAIRKCGESIDYETELKRRAGCTLFKLAIEELNKTK